MAMQTFTHSVGEGPQTVDVVAVVTANGTSITIGTREHSHFGAVAIAVPRGPHNDGTPAEASVSVYTNTGHMDDIPAHDLAEYVGTALWEGTTVFVGMHIDHATLDDIKMMMANARACCDLVIEDVRSVRGRIGRPEE